MRAYLDILRHILDNGVEREDRTGVGTIGVFGHQARFDLREGFPLLTTKKMPFRWIAAELLWFLSGDTNEKTLRAQGVDIWKEWATAEQCAKFGREEGDLGPVYGWTWRNFGGDYVARESLQKDMVLAISTGARTGFDQIRWVIDEIRKNPNSRRLIVSAWNPSDAQVVALPPCHTMFQFYVRNGELSCHLTARSIDCFLGLPFNLASYALLTHLIARETNLGVAELVISFSDLHIYRNHLSQVAEQLTRTPRALPRLRYDFADSWEAASTDIFSLKTHHVQVDGYRPDAAIRAEVAV